MLRPMRPLNVIIKGFEMKHGPKILERAFKDIPVGYCASILNDEEDMPNLNAKEHEYISATMLRMDDMEIDYDCDWNHIRPLDEELIYSMRECEAIVLEMFKRFQRKKNSTYEQRKRAYLEHLRYWNHIIEEKKIDLFLVSHLPHQCFDNVIYRLCKAKGIPTILFYPDIIPDSLTYMTDWEEGAVEVRDRFAELQKEYEGKDEAEIKLSPNCQEFYDNQTQKGDEASPWYMDRFSSHPSNRSVLDWIKIGLLLLWRKPKQLITQVTSPSFWSKKSDEKNTFKIYEKNTVDPDLSKKFVYVAFHSQPECSTSPMGGAFTDQDLIVQMLSYHLPDDVYVYVKEHPHQGARYRNVDFYKDLLKMDRVKFIPRNFNTFHLIENSIAVATVTGTVGFEALFRGKPLLLFGHRFYQFGPGVFPIHTNEDCKKAVDAIINGQKPELRDVKLFLKAFDDTHVKGFFGEMFAAATKMTIEENAESLGGFIEEKINELCA